MKSKKFYNMNMAEVSKICWEDRNNYDNWKGAAGRDCKLARSYRFNMRFKPWEDKVKKTRDISKASDTGMVFSLLSAFLGLALFIVILLGVSGRIKIGRIY